MSQCSDLSHLRCEIKFNRLSSFALDLPGNLYIRYYIVAGSRRKFHISTHKVLPRSNPCYDEITTECQASSEYPFGELLELHNMVFELPRRTSFLRRFTWSKLLGRAEVARKNILASSDMPSNRWIRFVTMSSASYGLKLPPSLFIEMKVQITKALNKQIRIGRRMTMKGCDCSSCEWVGSEEDMFVAATALNAW